MRKIILLIILLLAVFLLSAEVKNPDKPLKGEWDLKPLKVWELTHANGKVFATPDFVVSEDGTLYVNDFKNQASFIFDSEGRFKRAFAKKGEGPGEVRMHLASFLADDKLAAIDIGRLHYFSREGEYIRSVVVNTMGHFPRFFIAEDEYIFTTGNTYAIGARSWPDKGTITHFLLKTGEKKTIAEYSYKDKPTPIPGGQPMRLDALHSRMILGYDCKNRKIYYGMNDAYVIRVANLNGSVVNTFSLDRAKQKIEKEKIAELFELMRINVPIKEHVHRFPGELMHFCRILIDEGLVYVLAVNLGPYSDSQAMDIFSLDGKYLYRALFKPGSGSRIYFPTVINNIEIKKGYLYAVLEDSDGEISIVKYKISLPMKK
ncbi:MAG: 6-bladed beta-propeller [Candidatus Aminicenantes bacterium]|nr:MAG: 6-bladed beta-propeller [Candidatus Aminicenantes bacterium]